MEVATVVPADRLTGLAAWRAYCAAKQGDEDAEAAQMGHPQKRRADDDAPEEGAW